jgi:hypothetical protein
MRKPSKQQVEAIAQGLPHSTIAVVCDQQAVCIVCGVEIAPMQFAYQCPTCQSYPLHEACLVDHIRRSHGSADVPPLTDGVMFINPELAAEIIHESK